MFGLILFLALLNAFFTISINFYKIENLLNKQQKSDLVLMLLSFPFFALIFLLKTQTYLLIVLGIIFMIFSFIYLGIINADKLKNWKPFTMHALFMAVISGISGLSWEYGVGSLTGYFLFLFAFFLPALRLQKKTAGNPNIAELTELLQVINGMFFFIIGLIIASDRIRFLEKIARWLF